MPAPAVIPALKVYINTVVVKTPVVYLRGLITHLFRRCLCCGAIRVTALRLFWALALTAGQFL